MKHTRVGSTVVIGILTTTMLSACGTIPKMDAERYVKPIGGASVTANLTNYSQQLDCLGDYLKQANVAPSRFAVGRVEDFSGKQDLVNGKRMTQGAALMVISALAHTRLPIVERLDTSVAELELKYTDNKLIGDMPAAPDNPFRRTVAGTVLGSDYHIVGGITEVNYNVRSGSLETTVSSVGASGRYAVLDVAIDLRLVNTRTLQVMDVASVQKQIIGTEIRAGIFRFLSESVIDINAADKAQEPIQKAVRMLTERAVFQLVAGLYKVPAGQCEAPGSQHVVHAPRAAIPAPVSGPVPALAPAAVSQTGAADHEGLRLLSAETSVAQPRLPSDHANAAGTPRPSPSPSLGLRLSNRLTSPLMGSVAYLPAAATPTPRPSPAHAHAPGIDAPAATNAVALN